jgi:hypothetical protein
LRQRGIDLVARLKYKRAGSQQLQRGSDGDVLEWQRPNKPHGMTGEQYRRYPESLAMRQVSVDARDKNHRAKRFKVVTTILDTSVDGQQIGNLLRAKVVRGVGHSVGQSGDADGNSALQDARDGAQGNLGSLAGV